MKYTHVQKPLCILACYLLLTMPLSAAASAWLEQVDYRLLDRDTGMLRMDFNELVDFEVTHTDSYVQLLFAQAKAVEHIKSNIDLRDFATAAARVEIRADETNKAHLVMRLYAKQGFHFDIEQDGASVFVRIASLNQRAENSAKTQQISLDLQKVPVREALLMLAQMSGKNVVLSNEIDGNISVKFDAVPVDDAFKAVLDMHDLQLRQTGQINWIGAKSKNAKGATAMSAHANHAEQNNTLAPWITRRIQIDYADASDIAKVIESHRQTAAFAAPTQADEQQALTTQIYSLLSKDARISVDARTNSVVIKEREDVMPGIRQLIGALDVPLAQVEIETRLVQVRESTGRDLGVRLGFALASLQQTRAGSDVYIGQAGTINASRQLQNAQREGVAPQIGDDFMSINLPASALSGSQAASYALSLYNPGQHWLRALDLELSAIEVEGKGRILASPKILTLNKQRATIEQGQERLNVVANDEQTSATTQKAVLKLSVMPQITATDEIVLHVDIANDNFVDALAGLISTNRIATQVRLKNGETMIIGGIYTQAQGQSQAKVPWLGDLPVLGRLFRRQSKVNERAEMLVFLTPRILSATPK